jgi:hypothetical protein
MADFSQHSNSLLYAIQHSQISDITLLVVILVERPQSPSSFLHYTASQPHLLALRVVTARDFICALNGSLTSLYNGRPYNELTMAAINRINSQLIAGVCT